MIGIGRVIFKLFANTANMNINSADISLEIQTPNHIQQIFSGVDLAGVTNEELCKVIFLQSEVNFAIILESSAAGNIKTNISTNEIFGLFLNAGLNAAAAEKSSHSCQPTYRAPP